MSKILNGIGHVYTTRVKDSINCGKGVFDPTKIKWIEDETGKVLVGNSRVRVIGNGSTTIVPPEPPEPPREVVVLRSTWQDRNLAVDDGQGGVYIVDGNYYYTQAAASRIVSSISGWRLPSIDEINSWRDYLSDEAGLNSVCSTTGWTYLTPTNSTGFTALALGSYRISDGTISNAGTIGEFWSIKELTGSRLYFMRIEATETNKRVRSMFIIPSGGENSAKSVRLVKDA